jgi:hypothetical protein
MRACGSISRAPQVVIAEHSPLLIEAIEVTRHVTSECLKLKDVFL